MFFFLGDSRMFRYSNLAALTLTVLRGVSARRYHQRQLLFCTPDSLNQPPFPCRILMSCSLMGCGRDACVCVSLRREGVEQFRRGSQQQERRRDYLRRKTERSGASSRNRREAALAVAGQQQRRQNRVIDVIRDDEHVCRVRLGEYVHGAFRGACTAVSPATSSFVTRCVQVVRSRG